LLPPIASKIMVADLRENIQETLNQVQISCGEESLKIIRAKVPTYSQLQ
jgi:hypothetical protein